MIAPRNAGLALADRLGPFVFTSAMLTADRASIGITRNPRYPNTAHLDRTALAAVVAELQAIERQMDAAAQQRGAA